MRLLSLAAWGYLSLALLYTALLWLGGDAWWVATVLLFIPRWPALLPAPLLALLVLPVRPRLFWPVLLAALIIVGPAMGYRIGWQRWLLGSAKADLRLVTFNIDSGENPRVLSIYMGLEEYHPDVVVLQECSPESLDPQYWPAGWTLRFDQGICLASRFPLVELRTLERIATGDQGGTGNAMFYRLRDGTAMINLGVMHLETPRKGLEQLRYGGTKISAMERNVLVRDIGSRRLSRWFHEQADSLLIAGDFNMPVESTIYRSYWRDCNNAFSRVGDGFGWTRVLPHFAIRIDHVLSCGGWRALSARVGPDLGSDHRPLIVELARR